MARFTPGAIIPMGSWATGRMWQNTRLSRSARIHGSRSRQGRPTPSPISDPTATLFTWGDNSYGKLGDGTTTNQSLPVLISEDDGCTWSSVSAGGFHTVGLKSDGTLWAWGHGGVGALGGGANIGSDKWKATSAGTYHTVGLKSDGTLWAWGYNHDGQLGDGTNTTRLIPVPIGADKWIADFGRR